MSSPSLSLGIDTGGTFTDGVLLDPLTRTVVKKAKVLTTHHDLRSCIGNIIDALVTVSSPAIQLVSLSTTLATNSIAEGKIWPIFYSMKTSRRRILTWG
jgi:N-methylhydantoinase A/oxoprolinase/acetone carboxylase beta subunit